MDKNDKHALLKEQVKVILKKHGYKITGPRLAVLSFLLETSEHPDIQDIYARVIKIYPGIGIATVYRTLELFTKLRIADVLELADGKQRYEISLPNDHHHHLVCTECRKVVEFGNCNFVKMVEHIEDSTRFKIHSHTTIAYGICPQCIIGSDKGSAE